ncbi:MAG: hypothetical protein NC321_12025 [Clostridium sp.]|nr:hypothetical protein [Clostridium sp.]
MKLKTGITVAILMIFIGSLLTLQVKASGGEPIEGSKLEEFEKEDVPLFDGFEEMDYCLFLETNVEHGAAGHYYRYGIYGDFVRTEQEGEELFFTLNEKVIGSKLELYTHDDWDDNLEPFIQNISSDLEWFIVRQYTDAAAKLHTDTAYYQGEKQEQKELGRRVETALFELQRKAEDGTYELMDDEKLRRWDEITMIAWGWENSLYDFLKRSISAIDEYGKLAAVGSPDNASIGIYSMESGEELQRIEIADSIDTDWPLEISQMKGNEKSGWIVFSNGDVTYRMTYPDGSLEKMGEFMYNTTYSPDEKYIAYCTGNWVLYDLWTVLKDEKRQKWNQMHERWNAVGNGWYVEELETGKKTYIPIPIETLNVGYGPLDGGRCVWFQKDKLFQILNS